MNSSPKIARTAFMVLALPLACMLAISFRRPADLIDGSLWLMLLPNVIVLAIPQIVWASVSLPGLFPGSYRGGLIAAHSLLVGVVGYFLIYHADADYRCVLFYYSLVAPAILLGAFIGALFQRKEKI